MKITELADKYERLIQIGRKPKGIRVEVPGEIEEEDPVYRIFIKNKQVARFSKTQLEDGALLNWDKLKV